MRHSFSGFALVLLTAGCYQSSAQNRGFSLRDAGVRGHSADAAASLDAAALATAADAASTLRTDAGASADAGGKPCVGSSCTPHISACADRSRSTMLLQLMHQSGRCAAECELTLSLAAHGSGCDQAVLDVCGNGHGACTRHNTGVLSATAHERARTLASKLVGTRLADSYGCPGCADEPYATLQLSRNDQQTMHNYDVGSVPSELADADTFMAALLDALNHCTAVPELALDPGCKPAP